MYIVETYMNYYCESGEKGESELGVKERGVSGERERSECAMREKRVSGERVESQWVERGE